MFDRDLIRLLAEKDNKTVKKVASETGSQKRRICKNENYQK